MANDAVDAGRRRFLTGSTALVGGTGAVLSAWPFVASMNPSAAARDAAAPVEVDVGKMEWGQKLDLIWRKQPVWVIRRTPEMVAALADSSVPLRDPHSENLAQQPDFAQNSHRSLRPEFLVLVGVCTHLGCNPTYVADAAGEQFGAGRAGFFCACHGSRFDLAGRVYDNVPANANLRVPPYRFLSDSRILIGEAPA